MVASFSLISFVGTKRPNSVNLLETFCQLPPSKEEFTYLVRLYEKKLWRMPVKDFPKNSNFIFQGNLGWHEHFNFTKKLASYGVCLYLELANCLVCLFMKMFYKIVDYKGVRLKPWNISYPVTPYLYKASRSTFKFFQIKTNSSWSHGTMCDYFFVSRYLLLYGFY